MPALYLHIGHGKTGSSYIQSALALSGDVLFRHKIGYPTCATMKNAARNAAAGRISSGNGSIFLSGLNASRLDIVLRDRTLFSSEILFGRLCKLESQARLLELIEELGVRSIKVLLFLRDPVSNACSSYQQAVKRTGYTGSLTEFFRTFAVPANVNTILDFFQTALNAEVTIHNYSACRNDILAKVEEWLRLDHNALVRPPVETVNRSLTRAELELQLCINRHMGQNCGWLVVDQLCNAAPHIRGDDIRPPLSEQEALWSRLRDDIERVNARVPEEARYSTDRDIRPLANAGDEGELCFTVEQLDIIARKLSLQSKQLQRLRQNAKSSALQTG